ncbi:MAG: ZIP family metal transporter [Candidatus Thermoplasmatota archaeon]|nr:ZIP family metal transporter [Candidatus Thermoplasmatota archaeon]
MSATSAPIELAALTLVLALIGGLFPIFSKIKENQETLRRITGIASGILLASALLVVVPEGFELATGGHDEHGHDEHGDDDALAGSVALVILELEHGDIDASEAIEEIESLLGGHDEDEHDDHDEDDDSHDEEMESLSENIEHVIEEVESGEINATAGIEEIEELITSHAHEEEVHGDEEEGGLENLIIGAAILAGFIMMLILEGSGMGHAVHEEHHDHHDEHGHEHVHHGTAPWLLVLGLSLHSAADGLAIGSAAAGSSEAVTALVAMAVLIHKVPAAFSLGVFSMHERESRDDSIKDVALFALATPVMIIVSFYALEGLDEHLIALAMLFAAGTFLYVATVDTLPDIHNPETGREALKNVAIGVLLMALVLYGADAGGLIEHGH